MPRPPQSVQQMRANGNKSKLSKAELDAREAAEIKLGNDDLDKIKTPKTVRDDALALVHWKKAMKDYKEAAKQGVKVLTTSDVGMLTMYCLTYSEYEKLVSTHQKINEISVNSDMFDDFFDDYGGDLSETALKVMQYLSQLASLEGILKVETAINKKMDMLIKMQDRLFLNPLARIRSAPKAETPPSASKFAGFGGKKNA